MAHRIPRPKNTELDTLIAILSALDQKLVSKTFFLFSFLKMVTNIMRLHTLYVHITQNIF